MPDSLAEFIQRNMESLLSEWERFARSLPAGADMDVKNLRDHAERMLRTVAADMTTQQSEQQQFDKSTGHQARVSASDTAAESHGGERFASDFNVSHMVAEFRALRATVVRQWQDQATASPTGVELQQLIRFNEGLDQCLAESTAKFMSNLERSREMLLGVLAHEMRTCAGAVSQSGLYLRASGGLSEEQLKAAEMVKRSGHRLGKLISNLLDFTRFRLTGTLTLETEPMDLAQACRTTLEESRAYYGGRGAYSLQIEGDARGIFDRSRIEQVISNLIENAVKHGDPTGRVTVLVTGADKVVEVSVHNTGVPIPPERLDSIFDPLKAWTTAGQRSAGLGLGLYIARQIVEAHAGALSVTSTAQDGTAFTFRLPRGHDLT